jgi:hypothetical protein
MSPYVYRRGEVLARLPVIPWINRAYTPEADVNILARNYRPELCGTSKGYWQYRRYKQQQCPDCLKAQAAKSAEQRAKRNQEAQLN